MTITSTPRFGLTQWSADSDPVNRSQFENSFAQIETLGAIYLIGTSGNRPAAGTSGRFYLATDTGQLSFDTGSAWLNVNTPTAQTVTLTLPATYAVTGPLQVTSGAAEFLPPMPVPVPSGQTVQLTGVNAALRNGNATLALTAGGTSVAGLGAMQIGTTLTKFTPTSPVTLTDGEELLASVTSVSNNPDGLTLQLLLAYTATVS